MQIDRSTLNSYAYLIIASRYGDQRAERSQVPLINHIHEGLILLQELKAEPMTMRAWCLHPLFQGDRDMLNEWEPDPRLPGRRPMDYGQITSREMLLTMEYRMRAQAYLAHHVSIPELFPQPSALPEVNKMLLADKVQNCRDFERFHEGTHGNSLGLAIYFRKWLHFLSCQYGSARHKELVAAITP